MLKTCLSSPFFLSLGLDFYTVPSKVLFEILIIFFTTSCLQEQTLSISLHGQRKIIDKTHTIHKSIPSDFSTSKLLPVDKAGVLWLKSVTLANIKIESFFVDSLLTLGSLKLKKLCLIAVALPCSPRLSCILALKWRNWRSCTWPWGTLHSVNTTRCSKERHWKILAYFTVWLKLRLLTYSKLQAALLRGWRDSIRL